MLGSSNISTTVVGNTLGSSSHKVSELCTHPSINMWSWWKPLSGDFPTLTEERIAFAESGIKYPMTSSDTGIIDMINGGNNGWTYKKPGTDPYDVYRLGDFRNYKHDAKPPIRSFSASSLAVSTDPNATIGGNIIVSDDEGSVKLSQMGELKNLYFGIMIKASNGQIRYSTSSEPLSKGLSGGSAMISAYQLPRGNCRVYPILCSVKFVNTSSGGSTPPGGLTFYTIPNTSSKICEIVTSLVSVDVRADADQWGQVRWTLDVSVGSAGNTTEFNNNFIWLRYAQSEIDDPIQSGETRQPVEDFYLNRGDSKSFNGMMYINETMKTYRVWATLSNGTYTDSIGVIMPMP